MTTPRRYMLTAVALFASVFLLAPPINAQCLLTNGDFESGTLTGWTVYNRDVGNGNWFNYTGTISPLSIHTISAPPQGTRAATTDHVAPSTHALYQDFLLPAGQSGTLSFYVAYNNTWTSFVNLNSLDYNGNQQVRVDLIKPTAGIESVAVGDVWVKLFQPQPGAPLVMSHTLMTYDISGFAGLTTRLRFAEAVGLNYFPFAIDAVCISTTRGTITRSTATGSNVNADFGGVMITFPTVTVAGTTSLQQLDPATVQIGPPAGDTFIGPAYDLSTTAITTTPMNVCMSLPGITDPTTFSRLKMLHRVAGVWVELPTSKINATTKQLCATTPSLSQFTAAVSALSPTNTSSSISGIITAEGAGPLAGTTVNLGGGSDRKTITNDKGEYRFDDVASDGFYTVTPSRMNYHFDPGNRSFSLFANITDATFVAAPDTSSGNVIDSADFFVRQHYLDFLGREPDESGFNFWSNQILQCGNDLGCIERRRINVSAAYFLSAEFHETGGFVDGLYRVSYGSRPRYAEFMPDAATVGKNVIVGEPGWRKLLGTNKAEFVRDWVQRQSFRTVYDALSNHAFVDALISNTSIAFSENERASLISSLNDGAMSRAAVVQQVAENESFAAARRNEMFVMMEYFGYLRRDPDESGFRFWLDKLNQFNGNFEQAEMVKAFITSSEYRARFPK